MYQRLFSFLLFCLLGLVWVGCTGEPAATPVVVLTSTPLPQPTAMDTLTPVPTNTSTLTLTATSTATLTPEPDTPTPTPTPKPANTATPTGIPTTALGERHKSAEGGYAFQAPANYEVSIQGGQSGIFSPDGTLIISLTGGPLGESKSVETIIDEFLNEIATVGDGEFKKGESSAVLVNGYEGLAIFVTGKLFDSPLEGQAVAVLPTEEQFFFALAIANLSQNPDQWVEQGRQRFIAVLDSVQLVILPNEVGDCPVSTDESYGYTPENPIKVGGGAFDGPVREQLYMDHLHSPDGEVVGYQRAGSMPFGDTILDVYEVTGLGELVILYLDEYSYEEPLAPIGFGCTGAFPLAAP